jgi:hypothetical protein
LATKEVRTGRDCASGRKEDAKSEPVHGDGCQILCAATFTSGLLRTWASHPMRAADVLSTSRTLRAARRRHPPKPRPTPRTQPFAERMRALWSRCDGRG